jgi:DNA-binding transcriptional LysR family regulator
MTEGMDLALIKTFLEVSATGSFGNAAERLLVSQSAVSLRIQRLEQSLGCELFSRSKAGAEQTAAGREFERYALSLLNIWEEARQQVAIPEGFTKSLSIGGQYSLWSRFGFRLVDGLRVVMPELSLRTELGSPDQLTRYLVEGTIQMALMYTPSLRPGLVAKPVLQEKLVLVASWPNPRREDLPGRYVFVDWGPEFIHSHARYFPELTNPGLTFTLGGLTAEFISRRKYGAYLPARYVRRYVDSGSLHYVEGAPSIPFPVWAVSREDLNPEIVDAAKRILAVVVSELGMETGPLQDEFLRLKVPDK